jgi:adenylate kinase
MFKILIAGPQASGKGTQAEILAKKFNLPVFSAGNSLRMRAQKKDKLGRELTAMMSKGQLVPHQTINKIMTAKILEQGERGYILDGYPRTVEQFEFFDAKYKLNYVFEVYISDQEAFRRITGRRTCSKCQTVYHLEYNPPAQKGVCDKCGGRLVVRDDEKPAAVRKRLRVYHTQTQPMLKRYRKQGIYHKINGEQPIPKVTEDILKILGN